MQDKRVLLTGASGAIGAEVVRRLAAAGARLVLSEGREVFETNVWSPLALVGALAPQLVERGGGAIVNVGSMARVSPFPHLGHYAASRAALSLATQVLDLEL